MNRPLYETSSSLKIEKMMADSYANLFNVQLLKIPIQYGVDAIALIDKKPRYFIEFKKRNINSEYYDTYIISLSKYLKSKSIFQHTNKETVLVVKWTDVMKCIILNRINKENLNISMGGRTDRDDWQDYEPLIKIDIKDFINLNDFKEIHKSLL